MSQPLPLRPQAPVDPWKDFYPKMNDKTGKIMPVWTPIDVNTSPTLKAAVAAALEARKVADALEAEVADEWSALMAEPPSGFELKVGFAWGRPAWALTDKGTPKARASMASVQALLRK